VQLVTNADAAAALQVLVIDVNQAAQDAATIGQTTIGLVGLAPSTVGLPGGADAQQAALSLLTQLASQILRVNGTIDGSDTPLTADQIAQLQLLQKQVIDARSAVGLTISDVNWTFGEFVADVATQATNLASQAVGAVSSALGINWTTVTIGLVVAGVVVAGLVIWQVKEALA
jgi:hypothetical protein